MARHWTNGLQLAIRLKRTLRTAMPNETEEELDRRAREQAKDVLVALKMAAIVICGLLFVEWLLSGHPGIP